MKVNLIDYQENALDLLIYTKNTRLEAGMTLKDIAAWPLADKLDHLDYMRKTIKSSWEFVNYIFEIQGVSRAMTHQLVRTRTASFAQQSQRTVELDEFNTESVVQTPPDAEYFYACADSFMAYKRMIQDGVSVQDARNVLPVGTLTNIIMKADLRTLSHMAETRLCTRTQGEYQNMFRELVKAVTEVHPWAEDFLQVYCVQYGVCCFPNYKECPIQAETVQISDARKKDIKDIWLATDHVANPVSKNGKTM